ASRRRRPRGLRPRRNRRTRLPHRQRPRPRPRPPTHDPPPPGPGPQTPHLPLPGPRFPAHGCGRRSREGDRGVARGYDVSMTREELIAKIVAQKVPAGEAVVTLEDFLIGNND